MKEPIISLLCKLRDLEEYFEEFYKNLAQSDKIKDNFSLKNTASIFAFEEKRHWKAYQDLIDQKETEESILVDNDIHAQADYFLVTLKQSISSYGIMTAGQLIALAIDCENKQVFLLTKILEMLKKEAAPQHIQEVFSALLIEEQQHFLNLQPFNGV